MNRCVPIALAGAFAVAICPYATAGSPAAAKPSSYRGWKSLAMSNSWIELQVVPEIGGRVIQFKLANKEFFWVHPQLAGKQPPPSGLAPDGGWLNYGGDKLWPAPQGWDNDSQWPGPPDAVLDGQPYRAELLEEDSAVRLTSRDDRRSGVRFSRLLRIDGDAARVTIEATMTNVDTKPRRWGIWAHTQLDAARADGPGPNSRMKAWCPLNPHSRFAQGYQVIFGERDNPSFQPDAARRLMRVQYQYRVGKIGLDSHAGWVATVDGGCGAAFVQRFQFEPSKEYPDGSSVEFWHNGVGTIRAYNKDMAMSADPAENPYVFESEVLSPFARLSPGESFSWQYQWLACSVGGDFPVVDCTEAGVICEPLQANVAGGQAELTGRFGVFAPGVLRGDLLDAGGKQLGSLDLGCAVTPHAPVVLRARHPVPAEAHTLAIAVCDKAGHRAKELARAVVARTP